MQTEFRFKPEDPFIHAQGALDLLGRGFRGDYVGGMAEWLKNAVDAYIREGVEDQDQHIIIGVENRGARSGWSFECIDFVGATFPEVDEDFKHWCDPEAATKRGLYEDVYGGHGNGGKFHMRENFKRAELITYRDGELSVFRFQDKNYGFDPHNRGRICSSREALRIAGIDRDSLPQATRERFDEGDVRFSLVRGIGPTEMHRRFRGGWRSFVERLQRHGQARQLLDRVPIRVVVNGQLVVEDLDAPQIDPKPGFEEPREIEMPGVLDYEGDELDFTKDGSPAGRLILRTSAQPFPRKGDDAALNCVDIKGKRSIIATYRMHELGVMNYQGAQFIYGTLDSRRLEEMGLKTNERRKLPDNDFSSAVVQWIGTQVDAFAGELIEESGKEQQEKEASVMSLLNKSLNAWKNQLLKRFFVEVSTGPEAGPGVGGTGAPGGGGPGGDGQGGVGGSGSGEGEGEGGTGTREDEGGGGGDERKKVSRFPQILVSGYEEDPENPGSTLHLDPAQDVVYQRPSDAKNNVWWINAQRPLAQKIIQEHGPTSARWRDYHFQRFADVIITYAIHEKWREESDPNPDVVNQWITETMGIIQDSAAKDLEEFLFGKEVEGTVSPSGQELGDLEQEGNT